MNNGYKCIWLHYAKTKTFYFCSNSTFLFAQIWKNFIHRCVQFNHFQLYSKRSTTITTKNSIIFFSLKTQMEFHTKQTEKKKITVANGELCDS